MDKFVVKLLRDEPARRVAGRGEGGREQQPSASSATCQGVGVPDRRWQEPALVTTGAAAAASSSQPSQVQDIAGRLNEQQQQQPSASANSTTTSTCRGGGVEDEALDWRQEPALPAASAARTSSSRQAEVQDVQLELDSDEWEDSDLEDMMEGVEEKDRDLNNNDDNCEQKRQRQRQSVAAPATGPGPSDLSQGRGDEPRRPTRKGYPSRLIGNQQRSFKASWFNKYSWLEYSVEKDSAFCFACRHFLGGGGGPRSKRSFNSDLNLAFVANGYTYWKNATLAFKKHNLSAAHKFAMEAWAESKLATADGSRLGNMIDAGHARMVKENRCSSADL